MQHQPVHYMTLIVIKLEQEQQTCLPQSAPNTIVNDAGLDEQELNVLQMQVNITFPSAKCSCDRGSSDTVTIVLSSTIAATVRSCYALPIGFAHWRHAYLSYGLIVHGSLNFVRIEAELKKIQYKSTWIQICLPFL